MTTHPALTELIKTLETSYPDKATLLISMSEYEREKYLAKLELIEHIKLLIKDKK